ncbi:MAG: alpha-1,2-fucosyltransferase [Verrucomicrobiota bacterium]
MIITRLFCGLGNQMFQYAAGLGLAARHKTVLKLDVSWFGEKNSRAAHEVYGLSCFNITEQFATDAEVVLNQGHCLNRSEMWAGRVARKLGLGRYDTLLPRGGNWHIPKTFAFYPEFFAQPDGTLLDGSFQSEKFFAPVSDVLRLHFSFRYPMPPAVAEMAKKISAGPSVAVHIRRGDSLKNPKLSLVSLNYYQQAIARIRSHAPAATLYIFSDEIEAIQREYQPSGPHVFVNVTQPWHEYDNLRLMSLCDNFVIANSSFSWWAAWLGGAPDKMVFYPQPWSPSGVLDTRDIAPASWIGLPIV